MELVEFGKENSRKIVLIPGNLMSWRQFVAVPPNISPQTLKNRARESLRLYE